METFTPVGSPRMLRGVVPMVQPFTLREAPTFVHIIEELSRWTMEDLVPFINDNIKDLIDGWNGNTDDLMNRFNALAVELESRVNAVAEDISSQVTDAKDAKRLAEAAAALAERFASEIVAYQDSAVAGYVGNDKTLTSQAISTLFAKMIKATADRVTEVEKIVPVVNGHTQDISGLVSKDIAQDETAAKIRTDLNKLAADAVLKGDAEFNAADYGVVPDGVTDNTTAFQAAFDAAKGSSLLIPPGKYLVGSKHLDIQSDTHVVGYGATLIRKGDLGSMVFNFKLSDTTTKAYNGRSNITIEGLTLDARGDTISREGNIMTFNHARNITVINCTFLRTRGYHALEMNSIDGFLIHGCRFLGYNNPTGLTDKEAIQIDCANPGAVDSGASDGTPAVNGFISDCHFGGYGSMGAHAIAIGSHTFSNTRKYYSNIVIDSVIADGMSVRGINGQYWRDSSVSNSIIRCLDGATTGIRFVACENPRVVSNSVTGGTQGISLTYNGGDLSMNGIVSGNAVNDTVEAIALAKADGCIVSNNATLRSKNYGVIINGASDCLVVGNLITGAGYKTGSLSAIRVTDSASVPRNNSITGNKCVPHRDGKEASAGVSVASAGVDTWVFGNDFKGLSAATAGPVNTTSNRV